jgi:hypothetical protein
MGLSSPNSVINVSLSLEEEEEEEEERLYLHLETRERVRGPPDLTNDILTTVMRAAAAPPQALLLRHSKIPAVVRGEWSPQPRVTQPHSIFNSNKQYIL